MATRGNGHGGRREGSGRKPKNGVRAGVPHRRRPVLGRGVPVHVSIELVAGLPRLRARTTDPIVARALTLARRVNGVRFGQVTVAQDRLDLRVETANRRALSRAMQGFQICFAKNLNRALERTGAVFADRYQVAQSSRPIASAAPGRRSSRSGQPSASS